MSSSVLLLLACATPPPDEEQAAPPFGVSVEAPGVNNRWEARPGGAAHTFVLPELPAHERVLRFPVAVDGAAVSVDTTGRSATFTPPTGPVGRYAGLYAWDARGRALPAWMEPADDGLVLVVDAGGAMAPVTVDPTVALATWTVDGAATGASLGWSIARAPDGSGGGDADGDGYPDLLAGAPYSEGGVGTAALYPGGADGLDGTAAWTVAGREERARLGLAVAWAGDLDADGYDDALVGAPYQDGTWTDEGEVTVYRGSPGGPASTADATLADPQERGVFGSSVAGAGDLDGDGTPDVLIGASSWTDGHRDEGVVFAWRGAAALLGAAPDWTLEVDQAGAGLGGAVDGAGDVNADGYADLVAGAAGWDGAEVDEGAAFVWLGGPTGPSGGPAWVAEGGQAGAALGQAVAPAGDVDGDSYADLVVGSPGWDAGGGDEGRVAVFLGGAGGLAGASAWEATGSSAGAELGAAVAGIGDPEGDGHDDIAAGAPGAGTRGEGVIFGWSGATLAAPWELAGGQAGAGLGAALAGIGDVDGDGRPDLAGGAPGWDADSAGAGRVLVYRGSPLADPDLDGSVAPDDCAPDDPRAYPGATEVCDGVDNNCDGVADPDSAVDAPTWYADGDGDGHGDDATAWVTCDPGDGWVLTGGDCLDTSAAISPDTREACDGVDNNCDGAIDEGSNATWYVDADGDGYGLESGAIESCGYPEGYARQAGDCDDADARANPGEAETCDGLDEDCDGAIDEGLAATWYEDVDGDGYGVDDVTIETCSHVSGYRRQGGDCDDSDSATHPGAGETCDEADNNCDGTIDEGALETYYRDADADGYAGDTADQVTGCSPPAGYTRALGDCDDADARAHPGSSEACDGVDNDCDGTVDQDAPTWYRDADGDGYGAATELVAACAMPEGYASNADDCDDTDAAAHPHAVEACDGVDQDCDGQVDEGLDLLWYRDGDGDGHGTPARTTTACAAPSGWSGLGDDCDDTDPTRHPLADEVCDGVDQDCDDAIDEEPAVGPAWYPDHDADGFGDPTGPTTACSAPEGLVAAGTDCDDTDPATFPGAPDIAGDGIDQDCDGVDPDAPSVPRETGGRPEADPKGDACGCTQGDGSPPLAALLVGLVLVSRRRR